MHLASKIDKSYYMSTKNVWNYGNWPTTFQRSNFKGKKWYHFQNVYLTESSKHIMTHIFMPG